MASFFLSGPSTGGSVVFLGRNSLSCFVPASCRKKERRQCLRSFSVLGPPAGLTA